MTRAERLSALLEMLVVDGRIEVERAADAFTVSAATIRRDLDHLAAQQLLSRTHGGAVPNATSYDLPLRYRTTADSSVKARLGRAAAELLWSGCTVALNGGTTTVEVARAIPGVEQLSAGVTVLTNALNIAAELTVRPHIKIVVTGGVARPQSYELVGPLAEHTLDQLTPDLCFLGATGIDPRHGVTAHDESEAAINRLMMARARRTIVVADATKINKVGFTRICHLHDITGLLTDDRITTEQRAKLAEASVEVTTVPYTDPHH
ncbi:DeoR/GlpR family DNA-binding transcription regulator [Propionibacteriaceae bacterium Y1700]|uniref:DeoR/GlpR family DNA-binding transcription regulator n=1 Tax=Microlunatus sp. Y1700 TaxID=3418487 RepID=UPI003DA70E6E